MSDYQDVSPESAVIATMLRHIGFVQSALLRVRQELERRGQDHDRSKWSPEEFPGFARINATARQYPYGSEGYKASIRAERPTVEHHQKANSHHPEYHQAKMPQLSEVDGLSEMGWLDVVEMVCDWWAASQTYGNTPWDEVLSKQRERWQWSPEQWWLIEQVAEFLVGSEDAP